MAPDLVWKYWITSGVLVWMGYCVAAVPEKVCSGTRNGLTLSQDQNIYYDQYRNYENCTYINGNLELTHLTLPQHRNLSFLKDIREVTGYVLIVGVYADYIPLDNLRIIRGRTLYKHEVKVMDSISSEIYTSLYVAINFEPESFDVGLKELRLTSLHEIQKGDVFFHNNKFLCHENTVNWDDIITGDGAGVHFYNVLPIPDMITEDGATVQLDDVPANPETQGYRRACDECDPSCVKTVRHRDGETHERYCWGEGPDQCQNLTHVSCSPQCESRCYGPRPNDCCHNQCSAGCTGPSPTECYACKNVQDGDQCVNFCPPRQTYDNHLYKLVDNPNFKYTYGTICVKKCPIFLVEYRGVCLNVCPPNSENIDGVCVDCDGACPKICNIPEGTHVTAANIDLLYYGCTVINGPLEILQDTMEGDPHSNIEPLPIEKLQILKDVREVTEYVMIESDTPEFEDLSFLSNLKIIRGAQKTEFGHSLHIHGTSLRSLMLTSLTEIQNANILVTNNRNLCFVDNDVFNWGRIAAQGSTATIANNNNNCTLEKLVCIDECSPDGCWGLGNNTCLSCNNFELDGVCVQNCTALENVYQGSSTACEYCSAQCSGGCTGPDPANCTSCINVKDGPYCVEQCPTFKYADEAGICQPCHPHCDNCAGPSDFIGPGACGSCSVAIVENHQTLEPVRCLAPETGRCEAGYYNFAVPHYANTSLAGKMACVTCNDLCSTCSGPEVLHCEECKYYRQDGSCVSTCGRMYYPDNITKTCLRCHHQCEDGCSGPDEFHCQSCVRYKLFLPKEERIDGRVFNCTTKCPPDKPFAKIVNNNVTNVVERICTKEKNYTLVIILSTVGGSIVFIGLVVIFIVFMWRQNVRAKQEATKIHARMMGIIKEENEPLTPTDARPDMSCLRLIKESDLRKGNIIGSGAFGTVFKGMWFPQGENLKIPVAIKVLQDGTSPGHNKELIDEARVMASVDHTCCVRILAVCMTAQMMLITQLMPLGCLLEYVRTNASSIGSKVLLNWCTQIAKGMSYLEKSGIVHRDLAARNVLVQTPSQVKITDFGLAKLLDYNEEEYRSAGGKMPIKWLALECIQHRIFTHKSDIWSYGVTVWELFTYGRRPYENVRAHDVPDILEKGERLPQPTICTIDVYMIMIKCWMLDAESRPSFVELEREFAKMARDPGRYLVIAGDQLMRLPSTVDNHDMIRSLSMNHDGPEILMDAEDYLMPQTITSINEPTQINGKCNKMPDDESFEDHRRGVGPGRHDRYHLSSGASNHHPHSNPHHHHNRPPKQHGKSVARDSCQSRYSADPCKLLESDMGTDMPDAPAPPTPCHSHFQQETSPLSQTIQPVPEKKPHNKREPLVDEDDYLQPQSAIKPAYIDLIDGTDYLTPQDSTPEPIPSGSRSDLAVENPEYFDSPCTETTNISESQMFPERCRSFSTDESDPEYYNEYDQLNRFPNRTAENKSQPRTAIAGLSDNRTEQTTV